MKCDRNLSVLFCDDIRQEVGFKYSMMGCYTSELITDNFPVLLPKLCAAITVRTDISSPFQKLHLQAKLNDELIGELETPGGDLVKHQTATRDSMPEGKYIVITAFMVFSPLVVNEEATLRITAHTEDEVIPSPALYIRQRVSSDPPYNPPLK